MGVIKNNEGKFPVWLAQTQVILLTKTDRNKKRAKPKHKATQKRKQTKRQTTSRTITPSPNG